MESNSEKGLAKRTFEIQRVESPPVSEDYSQKRAEVWNKKVKEGAGVGKQYHNGVLYRHLGTKEAGGVSHIQLGLMNYSDRLLKKDMSPGEIEREFGKEHNMVHCLVQVVIVTLDGQIVVGEKTMSTYLEVGVLAHVSGNMNHDEVEVNGPEDVYTMAMTELGEETSISPDRDKTFFVGVTDVHQSISFNFLYTLNLHSKDIEALSGNGEFSRFRVMLLEKILTTDQKGITDFEESKEWLPELMQAIQGMS